MRLITERANVPDPFEPCIEPCEAGTGPLDEYDGSSLSCTRPYGHDGMHMAAFRDVNIGTDVIGPIWED